MAVAGALFKFSPSVRKDDREKGQNRLTTQSSKVKEVRQEGVREILKAL